MLARYAKVRKFGNVNRGNYGRYFQINREKKLKKKRKLIDLHIIFMILPAVGDP